jgi:hypothetical protein
MCVREREMEILKTNFASRITGEVDTNNQDREKGIEIQCNT